MMMEMKKSYAGMALDPLHIGAGGYRLGRVDNTIIRDPGTNLPKAPGSSISGVCRNYTVYGLPDEERLAAEACIRHTDDKVRNNCGDCVICKTFGYTSGKKRTSHIGLIKFFDAMIAAFPVATMCGPVWVTTSSILAGLGQTVQAPPPQTLLTNFAIPGEKLNIGWLYLNAQKEDFSLPLVNAMFPEVNQRLVLAPEELFSEIVNSNLEVRTSVAIDFDTGAAKDGALFTYEAMPRGTVLTFDIVVDAHRSRDEQEVDLLWRRVESGLRLFGVLGLGGMNTRGFGRMKVAGLNEEV